jgi:hypothetical protein
MMLHTGRSATRSRRGESGKVGLSTLAMLAVILVLATAAWKAIDFFILGPSTVKAAIGDVHDDIRNSARHMQMDMYFQRFRDAWLTLKSNSDDEIIIRTSTPHREGADIVITYSDSVCFPSLPTFRHEFRISASIKSW